MTCHCHVLNCCRHFYQLQGNVSYRLSGWHMLSSAIESEPSSRSSSSSTKVCDCSPAATPPLPSTQTILQPASRARDTAQFMHLAPHNPVAWVGDLTRLRGPVCCNCPTQRSSGPLWTSPAHFCTAAWSEVSGHTVVHAYAAAAATASRCCGVCPTYSWSLCRFDYTASRGWSIMCCCSCGQHADLDLM